LKIWDWNKLDLLTKDLETKIQNRKKRAKQWRINKEKKSFNRT
jgi:hypothetical protein